MPINGYKIQHALRELQHQREIAAQWFTSSLWKFPDDPEKITPPDAYQKFNALEKRIAQLQVLQARYNLTIPVQVQGEAMTLHEAVKRVGGAGRGEKMWRTAAKDDGSESRYSRNMTRQADETHAQRTVQVSACMEQAQAAARYASALREAIQVGNSQPFEVNSTEAALFNSL